VTHSLAIGSDGFALIAYYDYAAFDLKVAHCSDIACASSTVTALDTAGDVGVYPAISIGADGLGLIAYADRTNRTLKVAHCSDVACTSATFAALDSVGVQGRIEPSITIGADGLGLIGYFKWDLTVREIRVAHCNDTPCSAATIATIDATGNTYPLGPITTGSDGFGLLVYRFQGPVSGLKAAHCSDIVCSSATIGASVATGTNMGGGLGLTTGADGLGLITYHNENEGALRAAHCVDVMCSATTTVAFDTADTDTATSVTVGSDGMPLIAYSDYPTSEVRVAHCSNPLCVPYFRRH
jgi:hypothetical protein